MSMQHASNLLLFTSHTRFIPRSSFSYKPLRAVYQQEDWYGYQEFDQRGEAAAGRVGSASVIVRERSDRIDLTRKACPEPSRRVIPGTFTSLSVNSARNLGEIAQPVPSTAEGAAPRDNTGCRITTLPSRAHNDINVTTLITKQKAPCPSLFQGARGAEFAPWVTPNWVSSGH